MGDEAKVGFVGIIDPFLRGKKFVHLHGNVQTKKNGDGGILEKGAGVKQKNGGEEN